MSIDSVIESLKNEKLDEDSNLLERIITHVSPLTSKHLNLSENSFQINKKDSGSPFTSRGQINGIITQIDSGQTQIKGELSSYYKELYFLPFAFLFLLVLWAPSFYFGTIGFEWVFIFLGVILIMTTIVVLYQRLGAAKLKRDFQKFLERLSKK